MKWIGFALVLVVALVAGLFIRNYMNAVDGQAFATCVGESATLSGEVLPGEMVMAEVGDGFFVLTIPPEGSTTADVVEMSGGETVVVGEVVAVAIGGGFEPRERAIIDACR